MRQITTWTVYETYMISVPKVFVHVQKLGVGIEEDDLINHRVSTRIVLVNLHLYTVVLIISVHNFDYCYYQTYAEEQMTMKTTTMTRLHSHKTWQADAELYLSDFDRMGFNLKCLNTAR